MSTNTEIIQSQKLAFTTTGPWSRHLIGPVRLEQLLSNQPGIIVGADRIEKTITIQLDKWDDVYPVVIGSPASINTL